MLKAELAATVLERVGGWAHGLAGTWADLVTPAAYAGVLAYGPPAETRTTFVGLAGWLGAIGEVVPIDVEGWLLAARGRRQPAGAVPRPRPARPPVRRLRRGPDAPERVVIEPARSRLVGHGRGVFEGAVGVPMVLENGDVVGIWQRTVTRGRLAIRIELPERDDDRRLRRAAEDGAGRIGEALELPVDVSFGRLR